MALVGLAVSTALSMGGWQTRERAALRELVELEERLPHGHPAKEQLRQHVAERARLFADRSLEPTPTLVTTVLWIATVSSLVVSCTTTVIGFGGGEESGRLLTEGFGFAVFTMVLLVVTARLTLRTTRLERTPPG